MMRYRLKSDFARSVYLVDGLRTPWLKTSPFSIAELALQTTRTLLLRQTLRPEYLDRLIVGGTQPGLSEINLAHIIATRLGCRSQTGIYTLYNQHGAGMQALENAALAISSGRCDLILVGSGETMSRLPLWIDRETFPSFTQWARRKNRRWRSNDLSTLSWPQWLALFSSHAHHVESTVNQTMGAAIEALAYRFKIDRTQMDQWSLQSHERFTTAQSHHLFTNELLTLYDKEGHYYAYDEGLDYPFTLEKLVRSRPDISPPFGSITSENRSQPSDGVAFLLLASENALKKYNLKAQVRLADINWIGVSTSEKGLGPAHAVATLLKKQRLELNDIPYWEIDELFAGQLLACLATWQDQAYCQQHWGLSKPFGSIPTKQINVDGGSIAIGHPASANGIRILLHLAQILQREKARLGIATTSVGIDQGIALLLVNDLKTRGPLW